MYERMLNKKEKPTVEEMTSYCDGNGERFSRLNRWLSETWRTVQQVTFPYGNQYGWGMAHRIGKKLICNVFAEDNAFTVMVRLSDKQFGSVYGYVQTYTQAYIDHKYHTPRRTLTTNMPPSPQGYLWSMYAWVYV